ALRMSYPDFIEDQGQIYITETQKSIARVHPIDASLLEGIWNQHENRTIARDGLALEVFGHDLQRPAVYTLDHVAGAGFAIEVALETSDLHVDVPLLESADARGYGWSLLWRGPAGFRLTLDSAGGTWSCDSDPVDNAAWTRHHVVVNVDPASGIVTFVLNGRLCDGADVRPQGWYRVPAEHAPWPKLESLGVAPMIQGQLTKLRVYTRYLRTSEAV